MEILAGFAIALAIGITGVGAGSITAPVLILFLHQSASNAVTTALVFGTVVKLIATPIYLSRGHVNLPILKYLAMGGLPAALAGSFLLAFLDQKAMTNPVLLIVGLTVLTAAAGTLWRSLAKTLVVRPTPHPKILPWIVAPIGFEMGFSSAGAGALGTIVLMRYTDLVASDVVGTDLAFGLLLSLFAGGVHASMTGVPWMLLGKLLAGGVPGVLIGTQMVKVVSPRTMRLVICAWLIYIGGLLTEKGFTGLLPQGSVKAAVQSAPQSNSGASGEATKR